MTVIKSPIVELFPFPGVIPVLEDRGKDDGVGCPETLFVKFNEAILAEVDAFVVEAALGTAQASALDIDIVEVD